MNDNMKYGMAVSIMLETPAGVSSVFSCTTGRWERDYDKTAMDEGWEECVETHAQYLGSIAYEIYALYEIVNFVPVPYKHWEYSHN